MTNCLLTFFHFDAPETQFELSALDMTDGGRRTLRIGAPGTRGVGLHLTLAQLNQLRAALDGAAEIDMAAQCEGVAHA